MNTGQLKSIGNMVWTQLVAAGYTNSLPGWLVVTSSDSQAANLGQLKTVFNFDLTYSSSGGLIPDWWIEHYFGSLTVSGTTLDPDASVPWSGGQITYLGAYLQGLNPIDFYSGQTPVLQYVSGASQTGSSAGFVSSPLVVSVTDTNGNPLYDAPITFTVTSGGGYVQASSTSNASTALTILADQNGNAQLFFQLPPTLSSTSEVTATAGPAAEPAQVVFPEMSDAGGNVYPSPFAPSDIVGTINADGTETITWQNNDNQSPIYVYELTSSNTWTVSGTLQAGTTSDTVSASEAGSVQIGNNYSPGGSTGNAGGGSGGSSPASPAGNLFYPIPAQNYSVVDLSGSLTNSSVDGISLDDSNNVAFGFYNSSGNYCDYTVQNGAITLLQTISLGTVQSGNETIYPSGISYLSASGNCYASGGSATVSGSLFWETELQYSQGNATPLFPPNPPYGFTNGQADADMNISDSVLNGYCGTASGNYPVQGGTSGYIGSYGGIIVHGSSITVFDPSVISNGVAAPGIVLINAYFYPYQMNVNGWAFGDLDGARGVWTTSGTAPLPLAPMEQPVAINNTGQVIGSDGYLWTPSSAGTSGTVTSVIALIPTQYQNEVTDINPVGISGTAANGNVSILFGAAYKTDVNGDAQYGPLLLTLTSTGNVLTQVSLPSTAVPSLYIYYASGYGFPILNAQGIIATEGTITTGTTSSEEKALLFIPNQYQQVTPNSGFDWVSTPHWLMVPVTGTNQAIAQTPASSNFPIGFTIQATSSNSQLTVSPTSTTSSNQIITVASTGTNVGETYQVQLAVGTASSSGTNSTGLGIDVKPMTTGTIAIHAVTQHYTQPMAPPSVSGSFTPGTVCITWTRVEHTTPVSPDHDGPEGSGEILTGSDGICHTTAVDGDTQVIRVGQGIPADIAPQDTPSQADLQLYLNQVFGKQANLHFLVTRTDFTCNYDVMTPINGWLDLWEGSGAPPSPEEAVIETNSTSGVTANIYYVHDWEGLPLTGTSPDRGAAGITNYARHLAYVSDDSGILEITAHEIGHVLDLDHSQERDGSYRRLLPSGASNPVIQVDKTDPAQPDRLMYWASSGTSVRLVQPEWDIINPNKRSQ
jgi:hypothetical protein